MGSSGIIILLLVAVAIWYFFIKKGKGLSSIFGGGTTTSGATPSPGGAGAPAPSSGGGGPAGSWTFGCGGDIDDDATAATVAGMIGQQCDAFVGLGDYSENSPTEYKAWVAKLGKAKIVAAAYGNHDVDQHVPAADFGLQSWGQSTRYGGVTFASMNGESHQCNDPATVAAGKAAGDWIIPIGHEPIVTCPNSQHSNDEGGIGKCMAPLIAAGAKLALFGHVHDYERLCVNGVTHVVVGTMGASDYGAKTCSQACGPVLDKTGGFLKVGVSKTALTCSFIATDGSVKDNFVITKSGAAPSTTTPSSTTNPTTPAAAKYAHGKLAYARMGYVNTIPRQLNTRFRVSNL